MIQGCWEGMWKDGWERSRLLASDSLSIVHSMMRVSRPRRSNVLQLERLQIIIHHHSGWNNAFSDEIVRRSETIKYGTVLKCLLFSGSSSASILLHLSSKLDGKLTLNREYFRGNGGACFSPKLNDEIALLLRILVMRHTLSLDNTQIRMLDHFTWTIRDCNDSGSLTTYQEE